MKKKCVYCKNEFEQNIVRGSEQLYCSKLCRSKAGAERYKSNLVSKFVNNDKQENRGRNFGQSINGSEQRIVEGSNSGGFNQYDNIGINSSFSNGVSRFDGNLQRQSIHDVSLAEFINLITENANNKAELKRLQEKVQQLEIEKSELIDELDEDDVDEQNDNGNILSGIMSSYKTDPVNTISFAKDIIFELLKPKADVKL
jgi:hypothetical protein